ncbi:hypothetical protein IKE86_00255 [Candidatus Saccharibacteria bacterium]|nr:hypothetical protein [Candidatus Saccharibacteria bacterium]
MKSLSKENRVNKKKLFCVSADTGKILGPEYEEEAAQEMENGASKKMKPKYFGGTPSKGMVKLGMMRR